MKVKQTVVVKTLRKLSVWIKNLPRDKHYHERTRNKVEDTVVACFDFLQYAPSTDVAAWMERKPRRQQLDNPARAVWFPDGRRAILELIELTISEFEACRTFWPNPIEVGVLPVRKPVPRSKEHIEALQTGRDHQRKKDEQLKVKTLCRKLRIPVPNRSI